jgi:hypothetical protein
MGGVEGQFDVLGRGAGDLGERLAVDRRNVVEILSAFRCDPLAADKVLVLLLEFRDFVAFLHCVHGVSLI